MNIVHHEESIESLKKRIALLDEQYKRELTG